MLDGKKLKDKSIKLCKNHFLKMYFKSNTLEQYRCFAKKILSRLCEKPRSSLVPFATTQLCEYGFRTLLVIKTKSRNHLNAQADIRIAISHKQSYQPGFEKLLCN